MESVYWRIMKRVVGADSEHASYPAAQTKGLGIRMREGTATQSALLMWLDDVGQSVGL